MDYDDNPLASARGVFWWTGAGAVVWVFVIALAILVY